jgi:hypothetical protein
MIDYAKMKFGKKPARIDSRTLRVEKYFLATLAPAPEICDYTGGVTEFGMMLNGPNSYGPPVPAEGLGDCTIAAPGHAIQTSTLATTGTMLTLPDSDILQRYTEFCGYIPGDENTDDGGVEIDVLNDWHQSSFWKHYLMAYADPTVTDLDHIKKSIYYFGGLYIGLQLPNTALSQETWDVVSDASTNSDALANPNNGHAIWVPKYETQEDGTILFTGITWGQLIPITQAFWTYVDINGNPYVDEAHALCLTDFVGKAGKDPVGLDIPQMLADRQLITG